MHHFYNENYFSYSGLLNKLQTYAMTVRKPILCKTKEALCDFVHRDGKYRLLLVT